MVNQIKYFVFNKEKDFLDGFSNGVKYENGGLYPEGRRGIFISALCDSSERGTLWHRGVFSFNNLGGNAVRLKFYASDEEELVFENKITSIEKVIYDESLNFNEKEKMFSQFFFKEIVNPKDILLREKPGRFLWFTVEFLHVLGETPCLENAVIYFNIPLLTEFLPEIYRKNNSFLERYLSMFGSLYDDMTEKIQKVPQCLDPQICSDEFLLWLSQWIGVEDCYLWDYNQLRYLLLNGIKLYKKRGTREYVSSMVELFIGSKPFIVENYRVSPFKTSGHNLNLMDNLYGSSPYQFTVIVNEKDVPTPGQYQTLIKIIENAKPAHMQVNTVVLKPYIFLDKYSYLGVNSSLEYMRSVDLTGFSELAFSNISQDKKQ